MTRSIAYYEARITFGLASLLPLLLPPGVMLLGALIWASRGDRPPTPTDFAFFFERLLPLMSGLAASHLMTIEREEGFDEMRRTYPEAGWRVPLMRAVQAVIFFLVSGMAAAGLYWIAYGQYDLVQIVFPAFAPAFLTCAVALVVNNVSGSYWAAAGVIAAYWWGEFNTAGTYSQVFYLFNQTSPLANIDPAVNRAAVLAAGLVLIGVNTAFSLWRRRGAVG